MVKINHPLPRTRRCELLDVARSTSYYRPAPVSIDDLVLMTRIDRIHTVQPFDATDGHSGDTPGTEDLAAPSSTQDISVSPEELEYRSGQPGMGERYHIFVPMENGFIYLTVIMDWYSRKVLSWGLSNSIDSSFCVDALEEAIHRYGKPGIFNTDQGSQYTSDAFIDVLKGNDIGISMDGKGAWRDNVFVERLWRSVKYGEVYLNAYESMAIARRVIVKSGV
jgi:putative transposase